MRRRIGEPRIERKPHGQKNASSPPRATYLTNSVEIKQSCRRDTEHLKKFGKPEGVLFIGRAQENTPVFRTEKRLNPKTGKRYPWLVRSTAMVNHFYFYCVDEDFGPFFLKFAPSNRTLTPSKTLRASKDPPPPYLGRRY